MRFWGGLALLAAVGIARAADGEYLLNAAGCLTCHTAEGGPALAGGRAFTTPYGTFFSPNITPDRETGIGTWSRTQFVAALKHGSAPDGSAYFPVFPFASSVISIISMACSRCAAGMTKRSSNFASAVR